jgi:hypothetical protein
VHFEHCLPLCDINKHFTKPLRSTSEGILSFSELLQYTFNASAYYGIRMFTARSTTACQWHYFAQEWNQYKQKKVKHFTAHIWRPTILFDRLFHIEKIVKYMQSMGEDKW